MNSHISKQESSRNAKSMRDEYGHSVRPVQVVWIVDGRAERHRALTEHSDSRER